MLLLKRYVVCALCVYSTGWSCRQIKEIVCPSYFLFGCWMGSACQVRDWGIDCASSSFFFSFLFLNGIIIHSVNKRATSWKRDEKEWKAFSFFTSRLSHRDYRWWQKIWVPVEWFSANALCKLNELYRSLVDFNLCRLLIWSCVFYFLFSPP